MRTISTLLVIAGLGLGTAARAADLPAGDAVRLAVREALAEKADLPALLPTMPSVLRRDDAGDADDGERQGPSREARGQIQKDARKDAARAHAAAARAAAAEAAAGAADDANAAAEKVHTKKVKKAHPPHPPHPPHP